MKVWGYRDLQDTSSASSIPRFVGGEGYNQMLMTLVRDVCQHIVGASVSWNVLGSM